MFTCVHYSIHKHSLCYSMNYLFFQTKLQYCCDANIVAIKCVHFEKVHVDQYQLISTANAKDINTDFYCSDSRNESNGIFVLGVFCFQTNFDFLNSHF